MDRIDDLIEIGVDALNPLEVKAGMKPLLLKEKYGDKLVFHGGINAVLWDDKEAILEEIRKYVPKMKESSVLPPRMAKRATARAIKVVV